MALDAFFNVPVVIDSYTDHTIKYLHYYQFLMYLRVFNSPLAGVEEVKYCTGIL